MASEKQLIVLSAAAISVCAFSQCTTESKRPNVILIMTDDQGYGDFGFTGNKNIVTTNIDQLAGESYRFSNYHSGTTSAPTRSGLMSGRYGNSTGVWHTIQGRSLLDEEEVTLGQVFANSGYATAMFGKWHLGDNYPYRPVDRGFQESLYHGGGGVGQAPDHWGNMYFDDTYFRNGVAEKQEGYCTDVWFESAVKFIEQQKDEPFFCYISTNAPHSPYNIDEKYVTQFRDNDEIHEPRFYGMIKNIDDNVGMLRQRLVELGLDKNTIIIFTTDNGTAGGVDMDKQGFVTKGYNANMRGRKGYTYEGGHRVPLLISNPKGKGCDISTLVNHTDIMPTLIEMCNLEAPANHPFDGVSMIPLLRGKSIEDRIIVVDTQRSEFLAKGKMSCVMEGHWRLVNLKELYDLSVDPEQRNNIASEHPEMVERFKVAYDEWWEHVSVRADDYQEIPFRTDEPVQLSSHDSHTKDGKMPIWNQQSVRAGHVGHSVWVVKVPESGKYRIELLRYPVESDLPLLSRAPIGRITPPLNTHQYQGKALKIVSGQLQIGDVNETKPITPDYEGNSIAFDVDLKEGIFNLDAEFLLDDGSLITAYYVLVTKL